MIVDKINIYFLLFICLLSGSIKGQILKPAKWSYATSAQKYQIGDELELIFKVEIDKNWYLYSTDFDPKLGPLVTTFTFKDNPSYRLVGNIQPIDSKKKYDSLWEGEYTYFVKNAEFRQRIKVLQPNLRVRGNYAYQVCSDIDGKCIPFDDDFVFKDFELITASSKKIAQGKQTQEPISLIPGASGSIKQPAQWTFKVSNESPRIGDEIELIFKSKIESGWHLFSSDFKMEPGPQPTEFRFVPSTSFKVLEKIYPVNPKTKSVDTEYWKGEYTYFHDFAEFRQKIKILSSNIKITGVIDYQVCSDGDGLCIPFGQEFAFDQIMVIPAGGIASSDILAVEKQNPLTQRGSYDAYSLAGFMVVAFLAGLAALLTPCVFPMIPMTVTFFTNDSKTENGKPKAIVYGLSIIFIYTIAGTLVAVIVGPEFANWLATHWLPNLLFFAIFIFFALSFLGMFEITLPSSLVNNVDKQADKGGYLGVFFMAFTLVLVSFSCTGPIVGSILVESARGQVIKPVLGMFAFSTAFALPFSLFAFFPEWLKKLPKSGGWLNSVKVILGFLELALALKFLSVADQVYHWGLLDREVFLTIWIIIMTMMGFYLLGKIKLPGDSILEYIGVPRLILALATFSFVLYLIPGLFGAPLKALAGYLPPMTTHDFNLISMFNENKKGSNLAENALCEDPKYADMLHFPHGIQGYFDYAQALRCAREQNKPLFIDFTGHGCVNCREMEARVWSDPQVLKRLKNDFIMVALYVDEKTELPQNQWYTSAYDQKLKKSIGKQNSDLQITRFQNNAQPFYVILDRQEQLLVPPKAYDMTISNFVKFLDQAKENYYASQIAAG